MNTPRPQLRRPMPLTAFDSVPARTIAPGFHGHYVHSDQVTIGRIDIEPGALLPAHSHPHEQWSTVLSGTLELVVEGVSHVLQPGSVLYIPPHAVHSGRAHTACQVIDVFNPCRADYR